MRLSNHLANGKCKMRTNVYVDGFNLYYGALRGTPYKWLDLVGLFQDILGPTHGIQKVKYFTARVLKQKDLLGSARQDIYLEALDKHCPDVESVFGYFSERTKRLPLADSEDEQEMVRVLTVEEKGTDVNIAVHMLHDAWLDDYDCAVLVSNDGDLAEALRLVKSDCKKEIRLMRPRGTQRSGKLSRHADFFHHITPGVLEKNQLPSPIPGTRLFRPKEW